MGGKFAEIRMRDGCSRGKRWMDCHASPLAGIKIPQGRHFIHHL